MGLSVLCGNNSLAGVPATSLPSSGDCSSAGCPGSGLSAALLVLLILLLLVMYVRAATAPHTFWGGTCCIFRLVSTCCPQIPKQLLTVTNSQHNAPGQVSTAIKLDFLVIATFILC